MVGDMADRNYRLIVEGHLRGPRRSSEPAQQDGPKERSDEGRALFERLLGLSNDLGLLAEEYDVDRGRQVGNFPQAFSHLTLIGAAYALAAAEDDTGRPSARPRRWRYDDEDGDCRWRRGGCLDGRAAEAARRVGRDRRARARPLRVVRELWPAVPHRRGDPGAREPAAADAREPWQEPRAGRADRTGRAAHRSRRQGGRGARSRGGPDRTASPTTSSCSAPGRNRSGRRSRVPTTRASTCCATSPTWTASSPGSTRTPRAPSSSAAATSGWSSPRPSGHAGCRPPSSSGPSG